MHRTFRLSALIGAASLALSFAPAAAASPAKLPGLPQTAAARAGAQWLAGEVGPSGAFDKSPVLSNTAQVVLSLAAAGVAPAKAAAALSYLAAPAHLDAYLAADGADGPGQLAQLILDAVALGQNPATFGGTDLVTRLLATKQTSGADAGVFGTQTQLADYAAGAYQQGLALAALAATGHGHQSAAVAWLDAQQCPGGGFVDPDTTLNPCTGTPADFGGPDTNTTAEALEGLAAQKALTGGVGMRALDFLQAGQDADGGWSYFPNTTATPGITDPDSTALVVQGVLATGVSPASTRFVKGATNPISALLAFQLTSGKGAGAFDFTAPPTTPNVIATYQAVPALAGEALPVCPSSGCPGGATS